MSDVLNRFFYGNSIAVIGASTDPTKLGGRPIWLNKSLGFAGKIFPVHPSATSVQDLPAFNSIAQLPDGQVDCALVALPQPAVKKAVEELAAKKIPLAILLSSGFAEHSPQGAALQGEILQIARQSGMRFVGPNSMGGISYETRICATFTSVSEHMGRTFPALGSVSIASQSGFIGSHLMGLLRDRGIGLAKWLATGNQADIDIADVIAHYAGDDITRVIAVYVEGVSRPDALRAALERARTRGKAVVVLKVGRTELGARAIESHTAALVGDSDIYDAVFRRHGVFVAHSLDEIADLVAALDTGRKIPGPRLAVATVSGGFGILMSDVAATDGLELPPLSAARQETIKKGYPLASTGNPVDMGSLTRIDLAFTALLESDYDSLAIGAGHFGLTERQVVELQAQLRDRRETHPDTFIGLSALLTDDWKRQMQSLGIFTCEDPSRLIKTMAQLFHRGGGPFPYAKMDIPEIPAFDADALRAATDEQSARAVLRQLGISVATEQLASSADEAVTFAKEIGSRVVLKIASPDIAHKSDIGGVLLGLEGEDAVREGFDLIMTRAMRAVPNASLQGVLVSPQIEGGVETFVGFKNDPIFGPVVAFGLGGVFIEVLKDKAVELAPFGVDVAMDMIGSLKGADMLRGARGARPANLRSLADALVRVSAFAAKYAHIVDSLEINPLIALPDGAIAVDALLIPRG